MMMTYECLKTHTFTLGDYTLVPIRKEDIFLIKEWRNSQIDVLRQNEPLTDDDQLRYYHNTIVPSFSDKYPRQILFSFLKDNRCIGYGGLVHINWKDDRAEVSFLVSTQRIENKKQYENDFLHYLELIKEIAFNELKLLKITGETYDIREHHISIIEKSGFKLAGRLKQHIKINGKHIDALCHELFNSNIRKSHGTILRIKNILVLSISKKVPLLKRLKQSAQRIDPLVKIYGGDSNPDCIGKYFVDDFWQTPLLNSFSIDELIRYCKKNDINSIIPSRDAELVYFSNHNRTLEKDGINVMVSDKSTIRYCSDKLEFFKQAQKHNLPAIQTAEDIDTIQADFFVVKERFGAGSLKIGLNLSKEAALQHSKTMNQPVFQPYIPGNETTVDIYIDKKRKIKGLVIRKRDVVVNGESQITTTYIDKKLELLCKKFANKFNFYGHILLQIITDTNNDFHIVECNPRFGGASNISCAVGLDSFYWFILEANGVDIDNYPFVYNHEKQLQQITYPTNKIITIQ